IGASGPLDSGFVEMNCYMPRLANLKPGQTVKTRGDAGIFPPNIVIGQIVDSQPAEYGLYTVARVRLAANWNALEEVWVVFPETMNWLNVIFIFVAAFLAVFWEAAFNPVRHLLGAQIDLLPPIMVYASLTEGIGVVSLLALCGGLWFDSLSANPLG